MKRVNKWMAVVIAIMLILGMSSIAMAATITVTTPTDGTPDGTDYSLETYDAYKIFDAVKASGTSVTTSGTTQTLNPETGAISYEISTSSPWFNVLFDTDAETGAVTPAAASGDKAAQTWVTAAPTGTTGVYQITAQGTNGANLNSDEEAVAFANWLLTNKGTITADYPSLTEGANTVADGYYLITSSLGTNLGLATTDIPMTIVEKNQYPTVDKTVASADEVAQIGQDVTFTLTVTIPSTAAAHDLFLTDTMSAGLTFKGIVSVQNNDSTPADVTYTTHLAKDGAATTLTAANVTTNGNTFIIKFADTVVSAQKGKKITVTYKATVNKDAVVAVSGTDANTNQVKLDYSEYSQTDTVGVDTVAITLLKYDGAVEGAEDNNTSLAGAVFELHDADGNAISLIATGDDTTTTSGVTYDSYRVADATETTGTVTQITTVEGKVVRVTGLDSDLTYTWVEKSAPSGYNMTDDEVDANIAADSVVTRTNIENNKGSLLPSTGGIGRTIFIVVGGVIVAAAIVLLVVRKKRAQAQK